MSKPSTRNLSALPAPDKLERLCQTLAMLDAILSPDWQYRYYSFNKDWDNDKRLRMSSMRNGCGDEYYILLGPHGTAIKGYAHEYPMANSGQPPAGVLSNFPASIEDVLTEPAFSMDDTSFCIWCVPEGEWKIGPVCFSDHDDPDGSGFLLEILAGYSRTYRRFARDYFDANIPVEALEAVYAHRPITAELLALINPETSLDELAEDIEQIGYPTS